MIVPQLFLYLSYIHFTYCCHRLLKVSSCVLIRFLSVGKRRHSISVLKIALASCLTTLKSAGYCSPRKRMLIQEITSDTSRPHHIYSYQLFIIINNFYYHYHDCSSIVSHSSHCHRAILTGFKATHSTAFLCNKSNS